MRRKAHWTLAVPALILGSGFFVLSPASVNPTRPDCPGTIVCPISGRVVCIDHCPLRAKESDASSRPACCRKAGAAATALP